MRPQRKNDGKCLSQTMGNAETGQIGRKEAGQSDRLNRLQSEFYPVLRNGCLWFHNIGYIEIHYVKNC